MILVPRAELSAEDLADLQKELRSLGLTTLRTGCPERPVLLAPGAPAGPGLVRAIRSLGMVEQIVPTQPGAEPIPLLSRRTFLHHAVRASVLAGVAAAGVGGLLYARPPRTWHRNGQEAVVPVRKLRGGRPARFVLGGEPGVLVALGSQLHALSSTCTHRGTCEVRYDSTSHLLVCPCHNGTYDLQGNVLSGPPPTPLTRFRAAKQGDVVYVRR